jgi:hypothetical protein
MRSGSIGGSLKLCTATALARICWAPAAGLKSFAPSLKSSTSFPMGSWFCRWMIFRLLYGLGRERLLDTRRYQKSCPDYEDRNSDN